MSRLEKLLINNKSKGDFFRSSMTVEGQATVYLYDTIVGSDLEADIFGGISPKQFAQIFDEIDAPVINLRVNSPGGNVFGARAIQNTISRHPSTVVAHVDGLAASAASILIMAANEIVMGEGSFLMIHNAWTLAVGNAADLRQQADDLDVIDASLVDSYVAKTGMQADQIRDMMQAETWIGAKNAIDLGFADKLADFAQNQSSKAWDLSAYTTTPPKSNLENNANHKNEEITPPDDVDKDRRRRDLAKHQDFKRGFALTN